MTVNKDTQIQQVDLNQIIQIGDFGVAELMAMKESIAKKLSIPQFNLFMYQMNRMGLDPSLGHGVPILYGTDVNIRVEYEGIKSLAQKSKGYQGIYAQAIHENDDFEAEADQDGVITKVTFKIGKLPRGKVVGAFAVAKREGHKDHIVIVQNDDYERYIKKNPGFWKLENGSVDPDMAKKFAGTRAAKAQFDIATVVEENQLALTAGDAVPEYKPGARKDITAEVEAAAATEQPKKQSASAPVDDGPKPLDDNPPSADPEAEKLLKDIEAAFENLGITDKKDRGAFAKEHGKFKGSAPTKAELKALLKVMKLQIEDKEFAEAERAAAGDTLPGLEE